MQENIQKQDKYEIHYFLQMHGHIMYQHDITTSYQGNGTTFFHFYTFIKIITHLKPFKAIYQTIKKINQ